MMIAIGFWKNDSLAEHVLWEISGACVDTKPRGTKDTCIICGNGGIPSASNKNLGGGQEQGENNFVCMCLRAQSMMELNQKLTKHSQKMLDKGRKIPM